MRGNISKVGNLRRSDIDIYADILKATREGIKKTRIVYQANLNFQIVKGYLKKLLEGGLLRKTEDRMFITTEKGFQFIHQYETLIAPLSQRGQ